MDPVLSPELFPHIRVVMGMVIGLGMTRLLMTVAGMIQHPKRANLSSIHLLWMGSMLVELVLFWWWEFSLFQLAHWTFGITLFLILYAVTLFLLAALLAPDNIDEYESYEDFFLQRRHWFFGIFAVTFLFDAIDTLIKGNQYWERYGIDYAIQIPFGLILCAVAIRWADRRVQLGAVLIHFAYQIFWISQYFDTLG